MNQYPKTFVLLSSDQTEVAPHLTVPARSWLQLYPETLAFAHIRFLYGYCDKCGGEKVVPKATKRLVMKESGGNGSSVPRSLNLDTRWR